MLVGIHQKIADHTLNTAIVDFCGTAVVWRFDEHLNPKPLCQFTICLDDACDQASQIHAFGNKIDRLGIVSRDFKKIGKHGIKALNLFVEQFSTPIRHRIEILALIPNHLFGHTDRRQRSAQLMRNIGNETLLEPGKLVVFIDLLLEGLRHVVEGATKVCHFIGAPGVTGVNAHIKISVSKFSSGGCSSPDRSQNVIDEHEGDHGNEQKERNSCKDQNPHDGVDALLITLERINNIELVGSCSRNLHFRPNKNGGDANARVLRRRNRHRLPLGIR